MTVTNDLRLLDTEYKHNGVPETDGSDATAVRVSPQHTDHQRGDDQRRPRSFRALRLGRLRVASVAKLSAVFSLLGFLVATGTIVASWVLLRITGLLADGEALVESALGVDEFRVVGGDLAGGVVAAVAAVFVLLFVVSVLLTLVYNATCSLFGGITIEAQPERHRRPLIQRIRRRLRH